MVKAGDFFKFKHKAWEIQTEKWDEWTTYFDAHINFSRRCDHAGFRIGVEICGYFFEAQVYDTRHWDYEEKAWCVYPEDEENV